MGPKILQSQSAQLIRISYQCGSSGFNTRFGDVWNSWRLGADESFPICYAHIPARERPRAGCQNRLKSPEAPERRFRHSIQRTPGAVHGLPLNRGNPSQRSTVARAVHVLTVRLQATNAALGKSVVTGKQSLNAHRGNSTCTQTPVPTPRSSAESQARRSPTATRPPATPSLSLRISNA